MCTEAVLAHGQQWHINF